MGLRLPFTELGVRKELVTLEAGLAEDLGADSLSLIILVMELEDRFELKISDEAATQIRTVGDAVRLIQEGVTGIPRLIWEA